MDAELKNSMLGLEWVFNHKKIDRLSKNERLTTLGIRRLIFLTMNIRQIVAIIFFLLQNDSLILVMEIFRENYLIHCRDRRSNQLGIH